MRNTVLTMLTASMLVATAVVGVPSSTQAQTIIIVGNGQPYYPPPYYPTPYPHPYPYPYHHHVVYGGYYPHPYPPYPVGYGGYYSALNYGYYGDYYEPY